MNKRPLSYASDGAGTVGSRASSRFERSIPNSRQRLGHLARRMPSYPGIVTSTIRTCIDEETWFADDIRRDDLFSVVVGVRAAHNPSSGPIRAGRKMYRRARCSME